MLGSSYAEQLQHKREVLGRELRRYGSLKGARLLDTLPSPEGAGYRNRARMAVGLSRHGGATLGYFRAGTREIVDAPECGVLVPELLETTRQIRKLLTAARNIPRQLRHLDLRCGSDPRRQHLTLVFRASEMPRFPMDSLRRAAPALDGISINLNPNKGPQVIRGSIKHVWGRREIWIQHAGMKLRVSPGAFFQVNLSILPEIHALMETYLTGGRLLVDRTLDGAGQSRGAADGGGALVAQDAWPATGRHRAQPLARRGPGIGAGHGRGLVGEAGCLPVMRAGNALPRSRSAGASWLRDRLGAADRHDAADESG